MLLEVSFRILYLYNTYYCK